MSWGEDYNGGPAHVGKCPECEDRNFTNYDEVCEDCAKDKPVKCPVCKDMVHPSHMTEHNCCIICLDIKAEEFTNRILKLTK
jgi:hypothetical protein